MLTIIDDELGMHVDLKRPDPARFPLRADGCEAQIAVNRRRYGGKNVALTVAQDVTSNKGNARPVENSLRAELRDEILFIKQEDLRDEPQGAHRNVVLPGGLGPANCR